MTIFLFACSGANSGNSQTKPLILPATKEYPKPVQTKLATEIKTLMKSDPKPACLMFAKDYDVMTQETKVAQKTLGVKAR